MGEHKGWPQPNGQLPNGLLPNECNSVVRVLDQERWLKAEERTAKLIACIQPNQRSEARRNAVAQYVQRLIMRCFPCQVFTFGSVPLKTYLPDGDIDLTAFSKDQSLKDTWASQVRDMLQSEEKNENAEFHVKEVQYIQAEVKLIKCLVENIVVDISFNQLGGLCTLCFLEEVDHLISQNHLFKRSIILIKAWCYYESRLLGAHHGLISTYALETLVLYIFHVFNNSFFGPLEVLYRFLEFFSNFDWDNFCVSLCGPVSISSLPDVTAEPPRKDGGELLLSKLFLDACSSVYAVFPGGQDNQGQPFITKHFNVIDPLRVNNNLGRSVNKGNHYRIRSAFALGAKRLAKILDCPKENIVDELNQFFKNTWERHGSGIRPDAPSSDLCPLRPSDQNLHVESNKKDEKASCHEIEVEAPAVSRSLSFRRDNYDGNPNNSRMDQTENDNSDQSAETGRNQISRKPEQMVNESQGRYLFTRTRSSPELTDSYCDASFRTRHNKPAKIGKTQMASVKMDGSRKKSVALETISTQSNPSSPDDFPSGSPGSSHCMPGLYADESGNGHVSEERASVMGAQGMQQEEQDLVNLMASSSLHHFRGHIPMPMNMGSTHLPLPFSQSVMASMGYAQRTMAGNIPFIDPHWAANLHFHQGMMSSPMAQYFPGVGFPVNPDDLSGQGNKNFTSVRADSDIEHWHERDVASNGRLSHDDACLELHVDERQPSISANSNFIPSSRTTSPGSPRDSQLNEVYDRVSSARFSSASQSGSVRSKTSSESSWDGSSGRVSKVVKDSGRKVIRPALAPSNAHGKGKNILETTEPEDEERDRDSTMGNETEERSISSQSDSIIPIAPMVVRPGSRQREMANSGVLPYTFYPTGPPVPFLTMLPAYNFPTDSGPYNNDSGQNEGHDAPDVLSTYNYMRRATATESLGELKGDILNSDFASHWQNLQFGRFCQGPWLPAPCPSPAVVPPMYLHGRFPWDGPGRPLGPNANIFPHNMNYGPHLVPGSPLQSVSNRQGPIFQQYGDELPRHRTGTGTYLPNPKGTMRERNSSGTRRNNFNYDRSDHADREGNWNTAKARGVARSHNRNQADKSRIENQAWVRHDNGPIPSQSLSAAQMAYEMYRLACPYDQNSGYVSSSSEFGSLGPSGFVGMNDASQSADFTQRHHGSSSSADKPSSPHFHRRI